ncbi:MAG: M48 family metallopeptidase [Saprospiraceae bacterium]|nr:M48 family metallopeptidase [Saprospiraceae bacterium]
MAKPVVVTELKRISFPGFELPLEIVYEQRRSARVSFAKHKAILRLPLLSNTSQKEEFTKWAHDWISKKLKSDVKLRSKYIPKDYRSGQLIQLRGREFVLDVREGMEQKSASGQLKAYVIYIRLPLGVDAFQKQKLCSSIISRILGNYFHKEISERVHELNRRFFQKEIAGIRLKHNTSNWGSCSSKKNINLSTRLLLTPDFITDYIIIHELAHLVHMDHSDRFWKLVEKIMPNYKIAETWLTKNGDGCTF